MALFGGMILLPLYLQTLRGLSTLQSGLLLPGGLLMTFLAPGIGVLDDRVGLAKTALQHANVAAAINAVRVMTWLAGIPRTSTRTSRFASLRLTA